MLKYIRCFLILFLLIGCTQTTQPLVDFDKPVLFEDPVGKVVLSPVKFDAVAENPIIVENVFDSLYPASHWITISGLKDDVIQSKINQDIKEAYDRSITYAKHETLPPYRGLKVKIDKDYTGYPKVSAAVSYNKNNLLSIVINGQYQLISSNGSDAVNFNTNETLNYDLTTGRQIKISDLFTNDKPAEELLNPLVFELVRIKSSEYIDSLSYPFVGGYGYLEEVSPFKGVQGNQTFSLDTTGLTLYFDYRTPNFDTRHSSFMFTIPYAMIESNFAGTQRYQIETSPYLQPVTSYSYLYTRSSGKRVTIQEDTKLDGYPFFRYINYPQAIETFWLDRIHAIDESASSHIKRLIQGDVSYAYRSIIFYNVGPYSNIDVYTSIQGENRYVYRQEHETYDTDKKWVEFDDLFKEGYDIESILRGKIEEQVSYFDDAWGMKDHVDEYLRNMSFKIDFENIMIDSYASSLVNGNVYAISIYLDYKEIGCENLMMFDEHFK